MPRQATSEVHILPSPPGAPTTLYPTPSPLPKKEKAYTKPKKLHELLLFARMAAAAALRADCEGALDVGCGKGRLGGVISSCYGLPVIGLERDERVVRSADQRRLW